ncbi:MBL fold metallo-hydrolase [Candidatus Borreliella tachyglossi]|uniref:MBL fold metallo-hydrolase n=1 Tax=Candidatus Borreliella tachyglossi TaxID=1964448 RepID=UPI004041FBBC
MLGIFLGTGSFNGVPQLNCSCRVCSSNLDRNKRLRSSFFLNVSGLNVVIDTGPDIRTQLLRENISKIDLVLYTHEHSDHLMGLDDLRPYTNTSPLNIYARESSLQQIKNAFPQNFSSELPLYAKTNLIPNLARDLEKIIFKDLEIIPIPLLHSQSINSIGYRINNLAYLTDVKSIPDTSYEYLKGLDTLVIDASSIEPNPVHLNFDEATCEVAKIKPKVTYFTHLSHDIMYEEFDHLAKDNIYLAYDGLKINI